MKYFKKFKLFYFHSSVWGWNCETNRCVKYPLTAPPDSGITIPGNLTSLNVCQLICGASIGNVWPQPRVIQAASQRTLTRINHHALTIRSNNFAADSEARPYWDQAWSHFAQMQSEKIPVTARNVYSDKYLIVNVTITSESMVHTLDTNEDYSLVIAPLPEDSGWPEVHAFIVAPNFFGARNALETLSQLMAFDERSSALVMLDSIAITDSPSYRHRGISLDTARNFFPIDDIKRTIDGMSMVKLNVLHWHLTDSQSFPMYVESRPQLSEIGAFSRSKIYTREDMKEITEYARVRGIRVIPEFDQPAHVGEGWQFNDALTCFNAMPWSQYCDQPPCGQLDPSAPGIYPVIHDIYHEMFENFDHPRYFHMGGNDINVPCWNSSARLRTFMTQNGFDPQLQSGFMELWGYFQQSLEEVLRNATNNSTGPLILWSSELTRLPYLTQYLQANRHVIQWRGAANDAAGLQQLLQNGFRIIFSNFDRLFLDCGFSSWTGDGHNWCSPFKTWQGIYDNRIDLLVGGFQHLALGAEVAIWSDQIDSYTLDSRTWPRAAALAERLWRSLKKSLF